VLPIDWRVWAIGAPLASIVAASLFWASYGERPKSTDRGYLFHDVHFHLTNYIQEGTDVRDYLAIMGDKVGRSTLFGIPLQQMWSYENSGDFAPTYYLQTDAPLYYYSFTDAMIAKAYLSLPPDERRRLDPMITGFNPADMYGVDHIRRVLEIYPGVFTGIGEFTIHKEFVSSKVAGKVASLRNPALDRILEFASDVGLVVLMHCDIDMPFAKKDAEPVYLAQMRALLRRHPKATIIWAHMGLGRVVHPVAGQGTTATRGRSQGHIDVIVDLLQDPTLRNLYFDISWDEVAKYAITSPEIEKRVAALFDKYPTRFLFGTDNVAPPDQETNLRTFHLWDRIFAQVKPETSLAIRKNNYERLFDDARVRVRAWEKANVK